MSSEPITGVTTTGIYCQPTCTARPNQQNTRGFESQAAAEAAGFRACLRCRPYRTVDAARHIDGPEAVCNAIRLIFQGALDTSNEDELARRLSVSSRHLRRLFIERVGCTPDQLARSRRAHFARRLLDDTDLSISQVAFASGFQSVRRFNATMKDVFRNAPSELRKKRRKADRLVADGGLVLRLPFTPPLDFDATLSFLAPRLIRGVESIADGVYRRTIEVNGDFGVIEVRQGDGPYVLLTAHLPHWESLIHHVERIRTMFGLDIDPKAVATTLGADKTLRALVTKRPGLRIPGSWDPFEMAIRAIVGQQVSVAAATTIATRIVHRLGREVGGLQQFGLTHVFPNHETLLDADLSGLGLSQRRIETIRSLAKISQTGQISHARPASLDAYVSQLVSINGIGQWTANYLAMRLGESDAFPAGDLVLRRMLNPGMQEKQLTNASTQKLIIEAAEKWRPWRGYAAIHLWTHHAE